MNSHEEVLSFMDLLDLDEELIDSRLKTIMNRNSYTNQHLVNTIQLLQYKNMINLQEGSECNNDVECTFIAKLLADVHTKNIDNVCKIVNIVLSLNKTTIVSKSEHLIQQILSNIDLPSKTHSSSSTEDSEDEDTSKVLLNLKLCNSILDAVTKSNEKLAVPFLETPLENVLASCNEKLNKYFLYNIVPKLFGAMVGYNILDRIWNYVKQLENKNHNEALKILSCLSEFYLPVADDKGTMKYESEIVHHYEFWNILLFGLMSDEPASRKISVYLIKRSIDCLISLKKDVHISTEIKTIFNWTQKDSKILKENWNNFFILIDSLEEKQSNIVLPSLQLFESIKYVDSCWMSCAYNIGLKHDNTQVRVKCIEHRLKTNIESLFDATVLLEALNDINIYDHPKDCEDLRNKMAKAFHDDHTFACVLKVVANIKWSPVPLYHLSEVLAVINVDLSSSIETTQLSSIVMDILKIPCNNIPIRHAFQINITYFVGNCCQHLRFEDIINIYSSVVCFPSKSVDNNPFISIIKNLNLNSDEKDKFFKIIFSSHEYIDLGLLYLRNHADDLDTFKEYIAEKIKKIQDISNRQYSCKIECLNDVIFVTHLYGKTRGKDEIKSIINAIISREHKTITSYIFSLVQASDINLSIEEICLLFEGFKFIAMTNDDKVKELLLEMYRQMIIILTAQHVDLEKKIYAINIIEIVTKQLYASDKHKIFSLKQILHVLKLAKVNVTTNTIDIGRFRNAFYEKSCTVVLSYMVPDESGMTSEDLDSDDMEAMYLNNEDLEKTMSEEVKGNIKDLVDYVENVVECGGYGCLKWILKVMNVILPHILDNESIKFNTKQFLDRMWKEIEELKSNNQYSPCMREFVELITQDSLLKKAMYNNIVILYCNKIVEYGSLKNDPLSLLVNALNNKCITEDFAQIIYVLCDILMFSPVPKKDHRIADNVVVYIQQHSKFDWWNSRSCMIDISFNSDIQILAIEVLSKISHQSIFETIANLIMIKIEDHFKTKQRYHGNSQSHRLLLIGLQHLLFLPLLNQEILDSEKIVSWMIELLGKLPHQPSVRLCLEWFIALRFYVKNTKLDQNIVEMMKLNNIPLTSQLMILYWTLRHKAYIGGHSQDEFEFVMDYLLTHTMGQMFNIRLHAQYLATEIYKNVKVNSEKYTFIIEVIQTTFVESAKDKNFVRLREDFFVNNFDIVRHYTPVFIYYFLPKYCEIGNNEEVDKTFIRITYKCINKCDAMLSTKTDFKKEWFKLRIPDEEVFQYPLHKNTESCKILENSDTMGTIQKKYVPWKNMSDIDVLEKKNHSGELILVASLIDKLPNLGGMARTSEVFGVQTYVVDSLRHLQDKTFQGLSVSAENWVNIEEVRPGPPLKEYLIKKKTEGYAVVAAEQTSTSTPLQQFKFPKKTLLLLGHEKEGIPCDLLPMMDHCVEIPQQGFVRSLNVHVTAAIFVWEYSRQNVL